MTDLTIASRVLQRETKLRLVLPQAALDDAAVIYLLHGAGGDYRDWTSETTIAGLAARGAVLAMPDAGESYYINDARGVRFEDHFFDEVMPAVREAAPYATTRAERTAIVGISRGGFAAALYALKRPGTFGLVACFSAAMDLADRPFQWHAPRESLRYCTVFGAPGSPTRRNNDPNRLIASFDTTRAPKFYMLCGKDDVLLPSNARFAAQLAQRGVPHRFEVHPGGHDWPFWAAQVPALAAHLSERLQLAAEDVA